MRSSPGLCSCPPPRAARPSSHGTIRRRRAARWPLVALGLAAALALAGCGTDDGAAGGGTDGGGLLVVATTTQAGDFSRVVGGDLVEVTQLIPANVDPHDYEPSPADLDALAGADVLVTNGVGLESWLEDAIEAAGFDGRRVVMADGVALRAGFDHDHGESGEEHTEDDGEEHDPHIWQDPRNAKIMVTNIEQAFTAADPQNATAYQANLTSYLGQLDELDSYVEGQIATIPEERRLLVTNHDSFGYYCDRYGLTYVGSIIPSFDTSAELSGAAIEEIVSRIRETGAPTVFSESSLPPKVAETIGAEAGVRVIAGEDSLYADTLGPEGSAGETYLKAMRHNTDVIVSALR